MTAENYIRAEVVFKARTEMAVLIAFGDDETQEWIPRSTLSWRCDKQIEALRRNEDFQLEVAEWMALKIGLEY